MCFPLNSWHIKSSNQLVPLCTDLFLYNSICHQRLSRRSLLLHNRNCTNMQAALPTCKDDILPQGAAHTGGTQQTDRSPGRSPSSPNLNLGASRTPHNYVTLAECSSLYAALHFNIILSTATLSTFCHSKLKTLDPN